MNEKRRSILDKATLEAVREFAKYAVTSKLFLAKEEGTQEDKIAKAIVVITMGMELGIGAVAALRSINVGRGRVSFLAGFIAARIKSSGKYNYRVVKSDNAICSIAFFEKGEQIGTATFTIDEAKKAGLSGANWTCYPSDMLFARAISRGERRFCPDIFEGAVYTPDEVPDDTTEQVTDPEFGEADAINDEAPIDKPVNEAPVDEPEQTAPAPATPKKNGYQRRNIEDDF